MHCYAGLPNAVLTRILLARVITFDQVLFRQVHNTPKGQQIASAERRRRELKYLKEPFHFIHYLAVSFRRRVEEQMLERQRDVIFDQVPCVALYCCKEAW
jgi:hypothetical protein